MLPVKSALELEQLRDSIIAGRDPAKPSIALCSGSGCHAYGSEKVAAAFEEEIQRRGLAGKVDFRRTGCHGLCEKGPVVIIYPNDICYVQVAVDDVPEILAETIENGRAVERLLYVDPVTQERIVSEKDIPFYKYQNRLIFGNNPKISPKHIEDYIALGGYSALSKVLTQMTPEQVLDEVDRANVRGRGGAGFPAGKKWRTCREAPGDIKYVAVNCDEGDPGAYMDRSLMEGNPHEILEGLIIGAYTIGAHEGFIYIRAEYPLAVDNLRVALRQAEEYGFLGEDILGSGFNFKVVVHRGAGAFVSGESSALMTSIEGKAGEPRPKYVRTSVVGIWDRPTCLNNVETWANIPIIINEGAEWYRSLGTKGSSGTKIFSLVGKVNNTGLVEVPMGMTLRDIVFKIGGGIPNGKKFKAVQTGGPSGGCIPEDQLDVPVDFDELTKLGSMMGSGGMIVMDEDTCMVDMARYFLEFLSDESCGKCIPCRVGIGVMLQILNNICEGKGKPGDIEILEDVAKVVKEGSLCALGTTAANPVLTTLRYFRSEYEEHINNQRCPAGVCKSLIRYHIKPEACRACLLCLENCSMMAISGWLRRVHIIDQEKCNKCGTCLEICPPLYNAVEKIWFKELPEPVAFGTKVPRLREGVR